MKRKERTLKCRYCAYMALDWSDLADHVAFNHTQEAYEAYRKIDSECSANTRAYSILHDPLTLAGVDLPDE